MTQQERERLGKIQQRFIGRLLKRASDFNKDIIGEVDLVFGEALEEGLDDSNCKAIDDIADELLNDFYMGVQRTAEVMLKQSSSGRKYLEQQYVEQDKN